MKYIPDELRQLLEEYSDFLAKVDVRLPPSIADFQRDYDHPRFYGVVALITKRRQALDSGNIEEAKELLLQAYEMALKALRHRGLQSSLQNIKPEFAKEEITMVRNYCNSLLKALDGKLEKDHPVKEEREREESYEDYNRFIDAATAFAKEHGRKPTKQDLRNDYEFRGDFLKQVAAVPMFAEYLAKGKPGPKQSQ
jgi:hypothetical protein